MKGGTRGSLGYAKFLGAERARRDGIMSPRAEPPLARCKRRRKEAEKGRRDNGPFKKSLNRELVSSGGSAALRSSATRFFSLSLSLFTRNIDDHRGLVELSETETRGDLSGREHL